MNDVLDFSFYKSSIKIKFLWMVFVTRCCDTCTGLCLVMEQQRQSVRRYDYVDGYHVSPHTELLKYGSKMGHRLVHREASVTSSRNKYTHSVLAHTKYRGTHKVTTPATCQL